MTSASKVSELFTAAGEAFTKLAELARIIQTSQNSSSNDSNTECNPNLCWSAEDTELLQLAVKRFGDELNVISEHIKDKTMCQIKTTFKKIQPTLSNTSKVDESLTNNHISYSSSSTAGLPAAGSSFNDLSANNRSSMFSADTVSTASLTPNRSQLITSRATLPSESVTVADSLHCSSSILENTTSQTISNTALLTAATTTISAATSKTNAIVEPSSILLSQASTPSTLSATTAASICSSPSPFLHYPLLRKSADITLNMLNARDDSDEEDRINNLSLFNNV